MLIAWENEALLALREAGTDKFQIVVPSLSILAEPPVAVVDSVALRRGTRELARAYLAGEVRAPVSRAKTHDNRGLRGLDYRPGYALQGRRGV